MRKFLIQTTAGLLIIFVMLIGMFLYFQPKAVHQRSISKPPVKEAKISLENARIYTFEEASQIFNVNDALLLVNEDHPIDATYESSISEYKTSGVFMNSCVLEDYAHLSAAVKRNCNDNLYVSSSYRSYEDQVRVLEEEGPDVAAQPGTSEHQTGLAQDVYVMNFAGSAFPKSQAGKFVDSNCYDYGYILRYPYAMHDYTGFWYEPWHIRYVGLPHSKIIEENSIVFDDYASTYEVGVYYKYEDYLIARMPLDAIAIPADIDTNKSNTTISLDGLGYCFVTIKTAVK